MLPLASGDFPLSFGLVAEEAGSPWAWSWALDNISISVSYQSRAWGPLKFQDDMTSANSTNLFIPLQFLAGLVLLSPFPLLSSSLFLVQIPPSLVVRSPSRV